ncbi:polysaccharide pyruvyl transferase family protein [Jatrophihabitans sp. GAS493]|uniref:polysaccharide pyruvyl transferase family protein n=1 Tax=Jatrophihabitans sp. GAS493 TaxID=1907575 RepID=UPI0012FE7485|nr:polysaccharide pyruvyl transferase family protein [Jatrophihabitans sp. GAS493]
MKQGLLRRRKRPAPEVGGFADLGSQLNYVLGIDTGRRAKSLAIVGNYGNGNTGDEAILAGIAELLPTGTRLRVLAKDASLVPPIELADGAVVVNRQSKQGIKALLGSDVVAIGGGGMFGSGMPRLLHALPVVGLLLSYAGRDVIFVVIGAYPDMPGTSARLLQSLVSRSPAVTVRDPITAEFLQRRDARRRNGLSVVADPAVALSPATPEAIARELGDDWQVDRLRLVVSLKPSPRPSDNEAQVVWAAEVIREWTSRPGATACLLSLSSQGDFGLGDSVTDATLAGQVRQLCGLDSEIRLVGPNLSPRVAKGVIASSGGVVGARLHALIFAHAVDVPAFGIIFEVKTRQYASEIDAEFCELPHPDFAGISEWLDQVYRAGSLSWEVRAEEIAGG